MPVAVPPIQPQSFVQPAPSAVSPPQAAACLVNGGRVVTLRLPDADGRQWDFSSRGRLVLLDFWGTWCMPCLRAVPEVSHINASYAAAGLEVVGIACERNSPADNARRVRDTRQRLGINYRLVLADERVTSVEQQFHVTGLPTLVLLDADGTIIWRGHREQARELEGLIDGDWVTESVGGESGLATYKGVRNPFDTISFLLERAERGQPCCPAPFRARNVSRAFPRGSPAGPFAILSGRNRLLDHAKVMGGDTTDGHAAGFLSSKFERGKGSGPNGT